MRKLLLQSSIGIFIIICMLGCLFLYFQPKAVHARSIKSAPIDETDIDLSDAKTYTFEEASKKFTTNQSLLLVNSEHTINADFPSELSEYKDSGVIMNSCVLNDYSALSSAIMTKCNDKLFVSSSYRSYEDQARVLEEEGPSIAALPGTSEHQTGLAQDVYVMYYAGGAFIKSDAGKYVNSSCYDYGYIIRYPYAMQDYTGFAYEPWHIRYVGFPHSEIIYDNSIVFDDYATLYEPGKYYEYENYLIARMPLNEISIPDGYTDVTLSKDGLGYCFVTIKTAEK